MATPASTTSNEPARKKPLEQITFRFCSECSNMLYPKEDEESHKLQFTCRTCQYTEEAQSTCVFRNVLNNAAGETAGVTQDVGSDPTVGDASPASALAAVGHDEEHEEDAMSPVLCICCGRPVRCSECGNTSNDFLAWVGRDETDDEDDTDVGYLDFLSLRTLTRADTDRHETGRMAMSVEELMDLMDIDDEDPFDEYDEEREVPEDAVKAAIPT